jgi:hypothetical protein
MAPPMGVGQHARYGKIKRYQKAETRNHYKNGARPAKPIRTGKFINFCLLKGVDVKYNVIMKKICLVVATALIAASSFAQAHGTFDVRAGLNINSMRSDHDSKVGFNVGILGGYGGVIGFQSGLILNTRGAQQTSRTDSMKVCTSSISIYELQVPIFLIGTLDMSEAVKFKFHAGPTFGFGIRGKETIEINSTVSEEVNVYHKEAAQGNKTRYKRFDLGLTLGGGLQIHRFYIGVGYNLGLINLNNLTDDTQSAINPGSLMIDIGVSF